jgi:hypothetical protein
VNCGYGRKSWDLRTVELFRTRARDQVRKRVRHERVQEIDIRLIADGTRRQILKRQGIEIEIGRQIPAAAARVADFNQPRARQLALHVHEITAVRAVPQIEWSEPSDRLSKKRVGALRGPDWLQDTTRIGIREIARKVKPRSSDAMNEVFCENPCCTLPAMMNGTEYMPTPPRTTVLSFT